MTPRKRLKHRKTWRKVGRFPIADDVLLRPRVASPPPPPPDLFLTFGYKTP
ncbi:hypothetical protein PanWU01x14_286020 [Parasponia andersonii]|uniref:Uncharacterized protein n=1 Tax=Parasponia andersonii TaxID=3476 RepID=A0A2P5AZJ2_PARAD|nr:hypothetical protein PanWU01x14_286020 [Parasponia andersonii]